MSASVARDDLHRHLARDLAGRVPAHAVGDDEEPTLLIRVGVEAVFVASTNAPDIGAGGDG